MIMIMCSIRDAAVKGFNQPFFTRSPGEAIRMFGDETQAEKSRLGLHPEDYELYELGYFDDDTAQVEQHVQPKLLARAVDFFAKGNDGSVKTA